VIGFYYPLAVAYYYPMPYAALATTTITTTTAMFVSVTSPMPLQEVGNDLTVTGTTLPNANVTITCDKSDKAFSGVADATGFFAIPVHLEGHHRLHHMHIVAADPSGSASRTVQFNIATGD
jgi:hypothetical protein